MTVPSRSQIAGTRERARAGRKPKGPVAGVSHRPRAARRAGHPSHVTLKLRPGLPSLQRRAEHDAIRAALAFGKERFGFRLCHYAVLNDHLHLVCEAADLDSLRRGVQGLAIRIARALNRLWSRKGKVFADRYHDRVLRTPREVRNVIAYVLGNARRHGVVDRSVRRDWVDPCSSAGVFSGWSAPTWCDRRGPAPPVAPAGTWLLAQGWSRAGGRLAPDHVPGLPERPH